MYALGFDMNYPEELHNETSEIFNVIPNNVLYGINNDIYCINTQVKLKKQ